MDVYCGLYMFRFVRLQIEHGLYCAASFRWRINYIERDIAALYDPKRDGTDRFVSYIQQRLERALEKVLPR